MVSPLVPTRTTRRDLLAALSLLAAAPAALARPERVPLAMSQSVNQALLEPRLQLLAQTLDWHWERLSLPFSRLLLSVEQGQCLGLGLGPTPAREQTLLFSRPVLHSGVWALSRSAQPHDPRRVEELRGLSVCLVRDASYGAELDAAREQLFEPQYSTGDFATRLRMLLAGRCDLMLVTHASPDPALLLRRLSDAGVPPDAVALGRQPLTEQPVHIAAARHSRWAAYLPRLDEAVQRLRAGSRA